MPRPPNAFHQIRQRELARERRFLEGEPAVRVPTSYFAPSLKEICAEVVARTFARQPNLEDMGLDAPLCQLVTDQLPPDLPIEVAVPRVHAADYWRSCCEARWSLGQLAEMTGSPRLEPPAKGGWKRVYLERHLEETLMALEGAAPTEAEEEQVMRLCGLVAAHVFQLRLPRLRCHFDVAQLLLRLPNVDWLNVTFGVLNAGVTYQPGMAGIQQADAVAIGKALRTSARRLTRLELPENAIDDDTGRAIAAGLVRNTTLTHLDLSHNRIGDAAAAALATLLLREDFPLQSLGLADNTVREAGARALGDALAVNGTLRELRLRLNRLGDAGGEALFAGLAGNTALTALDVSASALGPESARALANAARSTRLLRLDLSSNAFTDEGGALLVQAAEAAPALLELDVREAGVAPRDEEALRTALRRRTAAQHMARVDAAERQMRADVEARAADNVRRTHGM